MKKLMSLFFAVAVISATIIGCNEQDDPKPNTSNVIKTPTSGVISGKDHD